MPTAADLQRLASYIKARRADLGMAQGDLAERGGPSIVTVGQLERAQIARPQAATLKRLDDGLAWQRGSAARVLAGGEPAVTDTNSRPEPEVDRRPVGLGLDDAAEGLTPEEIQPVLEVIRMAKRLKGLAE